MYSSILFIYTLSYFLCGLFEIVMDIVGMTSKSGCFGWWPIPQMVVRGPTTTFGQNNNNFVCV